MEDWHDKKGRLQQASDAVTKHYLEIKKEKKRVETEYGPEGSETRKEEKEHGDEQRKQVDPRTYAEARAVTLNAYGRAGYLIQKSGYIKAEGITEKEAEENTEKFNYYDTIQATLEEAISYEPSLVGPSLNLATLAIHPICQKPCTSGK